MIQDTDESRLMGHLEQLAAALNVEIRYEYLGEDDDTVSTSSGLCVVHHCPVILIDRRLDLRGRAAALVEELKRFDLTSVFIPPILRQLLEGGVDFSNNEGPKG